MLSSPQRPGPLNQVVLAHRMPGTIMTTAVMEMSTAPATALRDGDDDDDDDDDVDDDDDDDDDDD